MVGRACARGVPRSMGVELRNLLLLALDDLFVVTGEFIHYVVSGSGLDRFACAAMAARAWRIDSLRGEFLLSPAKTLKDYALGFVHGREGSVADGRRERAPVPLGRHR